MNIQTIPLTLLMWSAQVAVLTAAAALAAMAIAHPKGRLALWQGLLAVLLLLPAIEPWKAAPLPMIAPVPQATFEIAYNPAASQPASLHWRPEYWLWLIAAGAALRLLWMAAGFLRLQRYRRYAHPIAEPLPSSAGSVAWYASDAVPGPVTYGWRRPVILLPSKTLDLPADLREAIQCHELIHVHRGDWLWVVGETVVRSLLWFHPAIWFVMNRIQLAREQVVDQQAVGLLHNRDSYLDALVAVAAYQLRPDLTPAPLFLRKRHLLARVEAVVKEVPMSRPRMFAGITAVCSLLPVAAFAAAWMFPFVTPTQVRAQMIKGKMVTAAVADSPGVTVEPGGVLLHRAAVLAPAGTTATGKVLLEATLNAQGEVTDARVISGPQELRNAALSSVLQWHYQPGPTVAEIGIQFSAATNAASPSPAPPPVPQPLTTLNGIEFRGLSAEAEQELRQRLPLHAGDAITPQLMADSFAVLHSYDRHLGMRAVNRVPGGYSLVIGPQSVPATAATAAAPATVYRPGGDISNPVPISRPQPEYSEEAKTAKWGGTVLLSVVVDETGHTRDIRVLKPLGFGLDEKAIEAVSKWTFRPGMKSGVAVPVTAQIEVSFRPL